MPGGGRISCCCCAARPWSTTPWAGKSSSAARGEASRRAFLIAGLVFNLGLIATFKYDTLFVGTADQLLGLGLPIPHFFLPLAISFFTFEQISYLVDADARQDARVIPCWITRCSWPISRI